MLDYISIIISLAIVLLLVIGAALVYQRGTKLLPQFGLKGGSNIKIVERQFLGFQQQLLVVEYNKQQFMVLNAKTGAQLLPLPPIAAAKEKTKEKGFKELVSDA